VRAQPAAAVKHGDAGVITGSFNAEDAHEQGACAAAPAVLHSRARNNHKPRNIIMPSIRVRQDDPFDVILRRFRRSCEKAGVFTEARRREYYEKPTTARKRAAAAAVKRELKRVSRQQARRTRLY